MAYGIEEKAEAIVEALHGSDRRAADEMGMSRRSIQRWRRQISENEALRQKVEELRKERWPDFVERQHRRQREIIQEADSTAVLVAEERRADYTEKQLQNALLLNTEMLCEAAGIPAPTGAEPEVHLPTGQHVDILLSHGRDSYTVCEVKSFRGRKEGSQAVRAVGQLLCYAEVFRSHFHHEEVGTLFCADFGIPDYARRVLARSEMRTSIVDCRALLDEANTTPNGVSK